ncbi:WD repeat-containing protein [Acrasis kona]|uniref:WD repeat-containing protein n=1 Tax=Acrasis kona TaxID=1008807 RepID=A0AAW2ZDX8_9EUKA
MSIREGVASDDISTAFSMENKILKRKIEKLHRENVLLKKSLFEVNVKLNIPQPFDTKLKSPSDDSPTLFFDIDKGVQFKRNADDAFSKKDEISKLPLLERTIEDAPARKRAASAATRNNTSFTIKHELSSHKAAVHSVRFSNCGKFLVSSSHDKKVMVWDVNSRQIICRHEGHEFSVLDACFSPDSTNVASASIDRTLKVWDVSRNTQIASIKAEGFVQSVAWDPNDSQVYASDTKSNVVRVDSRAPDIFAVPFVRDECTINSVVVRDGKILTGNAHGVIKSWDVRNASDPFDVNVVSTAGDPISYLRYVNQHLSVNCYDNVLRIYRIEGSGNQFKLINSLRGHKNRNWPIKSSLFIGADMQQNIDEDQPSVTSIRNKNLAVTGSADQCIHIFDISEPAPTLNDQVPQHPSTFPQKLALHSDIVYGVDFHPTEPIIATSSGDNTIKIVSV